MQKDYPYALIQFYVTGPYDCSYLPDQRARSQVATPNHIIDAPVYSELVRNGFRRSGVRRRCDLDPQRYEVELAFDLAARSLGGGTGHRSLRTV